MAMISPIGIDTGGTFTDFVWVDETGHLRVHKQLSTPADPSRAVVEGLDAIAGRTAGGANPAAAVVHGSTVATNALLERRGARTGLITTAGFRDVLAIGRQNRPDLYALVPQKPPPLVPREWRFEVAERVDARGNVLIRLDEATLGPVLARLVEEGIESVAVCLLFAFLRPEHEQHIGAAVRRARPEVHVSLSSVILPEYREFERTAATVINAYVAPIMSRYLTRLSEQLAPRKLSIMQSNGGVISAATAGTQAARTALSGPAGGVVGALYIAAASPGEGSSTPRIITFDMGGTSTDVALCPGYAPMTTEGEIAGLPLRLPLIDIHTVGAGGGSLAYLDKGGALQVGPESAGASPGPAGYHADYDGWRAAMDAHFSPGRATVTDANLVLGRLDPGRFLGGCMRLHVGSAAAALAELAGPMGATNEAAALAVVRVANATMERAIRRISVERGHDPRRFTLVAFGGGGPLHACELAGSLRIPRVLIPPAPGVLSALGMLVAAPARDYSRTVMLPAAEAGADRLAAAFGPLEALAQDGMAAEGYEPRRIELRRALDMRYTGQSHELSVPYQPGNGPDAVAASFHAAHAARYGYARPEATVEIVTLRLTAVAPSQPPPLLRRESGLGDPSAAFLGRKSIWFSSGPAETALYDRDLLRPGNILAGPAILYQYDTTTVIPSGWTAVVDGHENLILVQ